MITASVPPLQSPAPPWVPRGHPVRWALLGLVVAIGVSGLAIWTGVVGPRVLVSPTGTTASVAGSDAVLYLHVTNGRAATIHIDRVGRSVPGLRLVALRRSLAFDSGAPFQPTTLRRGQSVDLALRFHLDDCAKIPQTTAIPVRVRTAFGLARTINVRLVLGQRPGTPSSYHYTGSTNPYDEPWPRTLTRSACGG